MVAERRADREEHVREASLVLQHELDKVDIPAEISGRAKHFYSIYDKMAKKGREFNEIYDLTAMRVIVERDGDEGTRDCYGALGLIHSLWKPMPGRFKDYIAMPKFNGYRALHTTVIGPQGRPLEIQVRTREMHATAEYGVAAHWLYKQGGNENAATTEWLQLGRAADGRRHERGRPARVHEDLPHRPLRRGGARLHAQGPGEDAARPARRRSTSPTPCTPTSAIAPSARRSTAASCRSTTGCGTATSSRSSPRSRVAARRATGCRSRRARAPATRSASGTRARRARSRSTRAATSLEQALKQQNLPYAKLRGSAVLAQVIRDSGLQEGRGLLPRARLRAGSSRARSSTR